MALSWGCDDPARRTPELTTLKARAAKLGGDMKYYTPDVHLAAFALPAYVARYANG
jgi:spermidine synthase